jgi:hypothetical protein
MPHIRKAQAGSDSFGNTWKRDGDVVEVPHEQAEALLAIDDGQFTLADGDDLQTDEQETGDDPESGNAAGAGRTRTGDGAEPTPVNPEFSEVHPAAPTGEPDAGDTLPVDSEPDAGAGTPGQPKPATAARKPAAGKTQE